MIKIQLVCGFTTDTDFIVASGDGDWATVSTSKTRAVVTLPSRTRTPPRRVEDLTAEEISKKLEASSEFDWAEEVSADERAREETPLPIDFNPAALWAPSAADHGAEPLMRAPFADDDDDEEGAGLYPGAGWTLPVLSAEDMKCAPIPTMHVAWF